MSVRVLALDFFEQGGIYYPKDKTLHAMAVEYAEREIVGKQNFSDYRKVLVSCHVDDDGKPVSVGAINCGLLKMDYPVWRSTDKECGDALEARTRGYLEDMGVPRGTEVFVHVADHEPQESRCPGWREWLRRVKAKKSQRWSISL